MMNSDLENTDYGTNTEIESESAYVVNNKPLFMDTASFDLIELKDPLLMEKFESLKEVCKDLGYDLDCCMITKTKEKSDEANYNL